MKSRKIRYSALLLLSSALMAPFAVQAEEENVFLEEIVVTATKRQTTLQDTPVAVSVTTGDTIEKAIILDLKDLQSVVPSLKINQLQNSTNTNFFIRGFGNGANNPGIEPSVGVFIDGVYRSRSASQLSDLPNLERVEVLKGPQSTLFGKNASAGVISVITKKPTGEAGGKVSIIAGNDSMFAVKAFAEGAFSENVAFDIYASSNTRDGYAKNNVTGSDINDRDRQAIRGQLAINAGEKTSIRIIADYDEIDELCCLVNNFQLSNLERAVYSQLGGQVNPNNPLALNGFFTQDPENEIENKGISLQIDHDFNTFQLTSITAFRNTDSFFSTDIDFTSADILTNNIDTELDTFTQEIRLSSTGEGAVQWMIGGYYFNEEIDYSNELEFGSQFRAFFDTQTALAGAPNALAGIEQALGLRPQSTFFRGGQTEFATLDNDAYSLFGQVDWSISDKLTATLGFNYTDDRKDAAVRQEGGEAFSGLDLNALGVSAIAGNLIANGTPRAQAIAIARQLVAAGRGPFEALRPLQILPPFQNYPNAVEDGRTDDDELTYTLRIAYEINENLNVYASYATGFKASSVNLSRDARPTAPDVAALRASGLAVTNLRAGTRFALPEESEVFELGLKARFERGAFNMAIFDQNIENFQSNTFQGGGFNLANAEEQSVVGLEFDLTYFATDNLRFNLAGTFLDPEYDEFTNSTCGDLSGRTVAGVHEVSLSLGANYGFNIAGMSAYVGGDYQYEDRVPTNDCVPEDVSSEEIKNLNMSFGIETENGLRFSIWARNLTDHDTATTAFPTVGNTGGFFGYRNQPRSYGVTLSKEF